MYQSDQGQKVQLGCGTLVLIAVIVMLFSDRGSTKDLRREIVALEKKIDRLEQKIDQLIAGEKATPAPLPAAPLPAAPAGDQ